MYLLDTNVVSELRKLRPHGAVLSWIQSVPARSLHVSAATFDELQAGAEKTRRNDRDKAAEIEAWISWLADFHTVIPIDAKIARESTRLMVGRSIDLSDAAMIAATARVQGLTVATRNVRDFE